MISFNMKINIDIENEAVMCHIDLPDGSWAVVRTVMIEGIPVPALVEHSDDLDVPAFEAGLAIALPAMWN